MLLLWAGSNVVFQLMRDASTADAYTTSRAAASLYEVPTPFLFLYIVDELFLPKPRSPARKAALAGLAAFAVVVGAAYLVYPWGAETALVTGADGMAALSADGRPQFGVTLSAPGGLPAVQGAAIYLAEAVAMVVAVRAALAAPADSLLRRQAVLVALFFGFLAGHNGGLDLGATVAAWAGAVKAESSFGRFFLEYGVLHVGTVAGLAAAGYAMLRLPQAVEGRGRTLAGLLLALPVVTGFIDGAVSLWLGILGILPGYISTRFLWLTAFAVGLAVAILRFDLAGAGTERSRHRAGLTTAMLALGVAGVAAGLAVSVAGVNSVGLSLGLVALASPAALTLPPLRGVPRRLAAMMTLDPRDPALDRERARTYAAALRASPGRREDDPALRGLRGELGLTARDHALLASVLDDRPEALGPGRLVLHRYRVLRELGRGGFGEAFLARDEREGRDVVLKRLAGERRRDAEALRRFRKEARLAGLLEHPQIVRVLGVEDAGGEPLLVMEYAPGGSLADRLRTGPLPEAEVVRIAAEVLDALGALHAAGIVHRDVKPSNILFDAEGRAKLGDFTLAREVVSGETRGGAPGLQGTFPYLAPEQARGLPAGPAADLYALGATLYEAVSGTPPFDTDGRSEHEAALLVTQRMPPLPVPCASAGLSAAIARALAKDPQARFRDAEAMASELRRGPTRAGRRAGSAPRRRRRPA